MGSTENCILYLGDNVQKSLRTTVLDGSILLRYLLETQIKSESFGD